MSWNEENTKKLRDLWKKGFTASQIASRIAGKSRNAIIGRAHRLNLESRAKSRKTTHKIKAANDNISEVKTQKLGRKARFKALILDRNFEPENPIYNLENLTDETCRYPLGHPKNDPSFHEKLTSHLIAQQDMGSAAYKTKIDSNRSTTLVAVNNIFEKLTKSQRKQLNKKIDLYLSTIDKILLNYEG